MKKRKISLFMSVLMALQLLGIIPQTAYAASPVPQPIPSRFYAYTYATGQPICDKAGESGISPASLDLSSGVLPSGIGSAPSVYVNSDGTNLFIRFRIAGDPSDPGSGGFKYNYILNIGVSGQSKVIVGLDGKESDYDNVYVEKADGTSLTNIYTSPDKDTKPPGTAITKDTVTGEYLVDFQVPMSAITAADNSITPDTPLQFYFGSSANSSNINKDFMTPDDKINFTGLATVTTSNIVASLIPKLVINGGLNITTDSPVPVITGTSTASNNSVVQVTINGSTYNGTVNNGVWNVNVTNALTDGSYNITATVTDATSGNIGNASQTLTKTYSTIATAGVENTSPVVGTEDTINFTVKKPDSSTDTSFSGTKIVTISGVAQAPDGSYGSFNGTTLTAATQTVNVDFSNGAATPKLILNAVGDQTIRFNISGVTTPATNPLVISPVAGTVASMVETRVPVAGMRAGTTAVNLTINPAVTLKDVYGNICSSGSSAAAEVTASVSGNGTGGWTISGTTNKTAVNGVVTYDDLAAATFADVDVSGAKIRFSIVGVTLDSTVMNILAQSATIGNVMVDGTQNSVITSKDVVITLTNVALTTAITAGDNLGSWITNLPAGLTATAKSNTAAGTTTVTIKITGTPTVTSDDEIAITIPAASLTSNKDLTVTENANAKFAIAQAATPDMIAPVISETSASSITDTAATLNFTSNEAGTYYYLLYGAGDTAPDATTIQAQGTAIKKGTSLAAAAPNTISLIGLIASTDYKAYIIVKDAAGNVSSVGTIAFTTSIAPAVNSVVVSPASADVIQGRTQQLTATVDVTGGAAQTVSWSSSDTNNKVTVDSNGLVSVASDAAPGNYTITATSTVDGSKKGTSTIRVMAAPSITTQPSSQTATEGQSVSFSVVATGDAPLNYQWRKDGVDISGATGSTLSLSNVQKSDEGSYTVIVTNGVGSITSSSVTLTVNPMPTYTVTFDSQGGSAINPIINIVSGSTVALPIAPTRPGYTFGGWNAAANGSGTPFTASTPVSANQTVYAQWTANNQSITLDSNYDSLPASTVTRSYNSTYSLDNPATRMGYGFDGWYTAATGGTKINNTDLVKGDITLYAHWTANSQTITLNPNYDSLATSTVTRNYDSTYSLAEPTRIGYRFDGWYTAVTDGTKVNNTDLVKGDIILYAHWTINNCTVTFDKNGGDTEAVPTTKVVTYGGSATLPTAPTKIGYTFIGWNTAVDGKGTAFDGNTTVSVNQTVYAQWTINNYTVTLDENHDSVATSTVGRNYSATYSLSTPTREGYGFDGWYTAATGGTKINNTDLVSGDITLYAHWTANNQTITLDPNHDSLTTSTVTRSYNSVYSLDNPAIRTGYAFDGWYTATTGGKKVNDADLVKGDITLYAHWTINSYTVTFDKNGGDTEANPATIAVTHGGTIILPTAPTRAGYAFAGWNTELNGTGTPFTESTIVSANQTVYAQWNRTYTLNYTAGTGGTITGALSQTVTSGSNGTSVTAVPNPGYYFVNWSDGVTTAARTDSSVANDINITAIFAEISHSDGGSSYTPASSGLQIAANVVDPSADNKTVSAVKATVITNTDGTDTINVKQSDAIVMKQPDGTNTPFQDYSKIKYKAPENVPVTINSDGTIKINNVTKGNDYNIPVIYDLGNGEKITIGNMHISVDSTGNVSMTSDLIDPYGIITDSLSGNVISGANVVLYYADTVRNKQSGRTPDTAVNLPIINGFKPNNNQNPQTTDSEGAYGYMVYPNTDYYIVITKDGYEIFTSPTISVADKLVKFSARLNRQISGVKRIAGNTRIDTAIELAKSEFTGKVKNIIFAAASNYPDGLTGSVLAYQQNAPILLVGDSQEEQDKVLTYMKNYLDSNGKVFILGGTGVMTQSFENQIKAAGYPNVIRLGGADRYETATKIAEYLNVDEGTPIVIASGENYPDALSVSSAAAVNQYPILLVRGNEIPDSIKSELAKIKPSKVYIIGKKGSISDIVETQLAQPTSLDSSSIVRLGGEDRYSTSVAIARNFKLSGKSVCIAAGSNFPDALAGSIYSANYNAPILLVEGTLTDEEKAYILDSKLSGTTIFGGDGAVNSQIENEVTRLLGK